MVTNVTDNRALCEVWGSHCGIQAKPAFMLRTWCQQHARQLMEFVQLSSGRRLRTLLYGSDMAPITPREWSPVTITELFGDGDNAGMLAFVELIPDG